VTTLKKDNLIGLIPAAGSGTRLNLPFPKELYPLHQFNKYKPVANFMVDSLVQTGIRHIIFVINETKHQLLGYFGSGKNFGCDFSYVVQDKISNGQSTSPGLADALASAYHIIREKTVLFGMADTIMSPKNAIRIGLNALNTYVDMTMCLFPTQYPEKFGMVSINDEGQVLQIVDKPKATHLKFMWGCIIWRPVFTEYLFSKVRKENIGDFADLLNQAISDGIKINSVKFTDGKFIDFGTYEQIIQYFENTNPNLFR